MVATPHLIDDSRRPSEGLRRNLADDRGELIDEPVPVGGIQKTIRDRGLQVPDCPFDVPRSGLAVGRRLSELLQRRGCLCGGILHLVRQRRPGVVVDDALKLGHDLLESLVCGGIRGREDILRWFNGGVGILSEFAIVDGVRWITRIPGVVGALVSGLGRRLGGVCRVVGGLFAGGGGLVRFVGTGVVRLAGVDRCGRSPLSVW